MTMPSNPMEHDMLSMAHSRRDISAQEGFHPAVKIYRQVYARCLLPTVVVLAPHPAFLPSILLLAPVRGSLREGTVFPGTFPHMLGYVSILGERLFAIFWDSTGGARKVICNIWGIHLTISNVGVTCPPYQRSPEPAVGLDVSLCPGCHGSHG